MENGKNALQNITTDWTPHSVNSQICIHTFARTAGSGLSEAGPALARDLPASAEDLTDFVLAALVLALSFRIGLLGRRGVP